MKQSLSYSSEIEQLKLQNKDLISQNERLVAENEAMIIELKAKYFDDVQTLTQERQRLQASLSARIKEIGPQREELEEKIASCNKQVRKIQAENMQLKLDIDSLQQKFLTIAIEAGNSRKDATIEHDESTIVAKSKVLEAKDSIISGMNQQLTRESSKQQVCGHTCLEY